MLHGRSERWGGGEGEAGLGKWDSHKQMQERVSARGCLIHPFVHLSERQGGGAWPNWIGAKAMQSSCRPRRERSSVLPCLTLPLHCSTGSGRR